MGISKEAIWKLSSYLWVKHSVPGFTPIDSMIRYHHPSNFPLLGASKAMKYLLALDFSARYMYLDTFEEFPGSKTKQSICLLQEWL